jgi:hypothetical protein
MDANLVIADLSMANLDGVALCGANLNYANLSGANLRAANLFETKFGAAVLIGADLSTANLSWAVFNGAILNGANFNEVKLQYASIADVDLSMVKGLESLDHSGPSSIGVDTIFKSRGDIPEVFLRGCGLDESLITFVRSLTTTPTQFYSCFISYSHADASFARRLHNALQSQGIRCWLDEKQMLPGDDIYEQVDRGIRLWDKVLLCCSKDALTSGWVDNEIDTAFEKERKLMAQRGRKVLALIPLNLDDYLFSDEWVSGKKRQVLSRLAPDFTNLDKDKDKFEAQLEKVVKALQTDDTGREPAPEPRL